jgi:hypothetical protein
MRQEGEVIERILLASDGPGAWTAAAAVVDLVAAPQALVEVEVLHVNEVESTRCRPRSLLRSAVAGSVSRAVIMRAGFPVMVVREPGCRL